MIGMFNFSSRAHYDAATANVVFVGNSLVDTSVSAEMVLDVASQAPISGNLTIQNFGHAGQSTVQLETFAAEVDASYAPGKKNYLLFWELTNSIWNVSSRTGMQAAADVAAYIAARQAVRVAASQAPWRVIVLTGLPRNASNASTWTNAQAETEMLAANNYIQSNYKSMGAVDIVDVRRADGPFAFSDTTNSANYALYTDQVHLRPAGQQIIAGYVASVLKRQPA